MSDRERVLDDLGVVGDELTVIEERRAELYAARLDLFLRGRALDPPITQRELGEACGVGELAVGAQLRKAAARANA